MTWTSGGRRASLSRSRNGAFVDATLAVATGGAPRESDQPMHATDADTKTEMVEVTIETFDTETVDLELVPFEE